MTISTVQDLAMNLCKGALIAEILNDTIKDEVKDTIRDIFKNAVKETPKNMGRIFRDLKSDILALHDSCLDFFRYVHGKKTEKSAPFRACMAAVTRIFLRTFGATLALGALAGTVFCGAYVIACFSPFAHSAVFSVTSERVAAFALKSLAALFGAHGSFTIAKACS